MTCEKTSAAADPAQVSRTASSAVPGMPTAIADAKTAAEHRQLADYFARKAAQYEDEANAHDWSLSAYTAGGNGYPASYMGHCRLLRNALTSAALEARALEQGHRIMAEGLDR